jgi:hypothetical protein
VLTTADELAIVTKEVRDDGGETWRLGFDVSKDESAIYHPSFPLLLTSILLPERTNSEDVEATVGDVLRVDEWYGSDQLAGTMKLPDGQEVTISTGSANATFVKVDLPGAYAFHAAGTTQYRVANVPRDASNSSLSLDEMTELLGSPELTMITTRSRIRPEDFQQMETAESVTSRRKKRRDLSPIVFILALIFLSVESILLYSVWKRKASVAE